MDDGGEGQNRLIRVKQILQIATKSIAKSHKSAAIRLLAQTRTISRALSHLAIFC